MSATGLFAANGDSDSIQITEHFDCTQDELWAAITDSDQLSAWFGGTCSIEPRVDGQVRFELPDDAVSAYGVVRGYKPPRPDLTVATVSHTFVDAARPDLTSVCTWAVVRLDAGCDLHFSMDGTGELGGSGFAEVLRDVTGTETDTTTEAQAVAALGSARTVLLVDWVLDEIPRTIARVAPVTYAKVGPKPDDWALVEPDDVGREYRVTRVPRPEHVDLLHLDWTLGFDDFVAEAHDMGASTFWYHSARTRPPAPADNRGVWVPARRSARQRRAVEAGGMTYIDSHYIVDIANRVTRTAEQ